MAMASLQVDFPEQLDRHSLGAQAMLDDTVTGTPAQAISTYALVIRWVVTLHLLAFAAQLATAISFVAGVAGALFPHMHNAWAAMTLGLIQAALLLSVPAARLRLPYRLMAIAVVLGEAAQIHFGTTLGLAVHVTTAMLLWAFSLALAIKVWAPTWKLAE
jgi:hypothetical protein